MTVKINLRNDIGHFKTLHSVNSAWHKKHHLLYQKTFKEAFLEDIVDIYLGTTGKIVIRSVEFGAIESHHLFGLDELIIFAWYELNSERYKRCLDLGGNIGVHSLILNKLGFSVVAYEPDPVHVQLFKQTMQDNNSTKIDLRERAVGVNSGRSEFTRVLGNTTGSHLSGAKLEPYGDLERIIVEVESITSVLDEGFDFIKMDIEGYEAPVIESLIPDHFDNLEIMLEIGSFENARRIYRQLDRLGINAYSQKRGWARANSFLDLPISHREGSVLLTRSSFMDWRI